MRDKAPLVSVVIPSFNMARYLPYAVDSALSQSYPNVEVVVVDDGSQDNTRAVAVQYGDRITYIYQENMGVAAALNTAIAASRGEYIRLLAADDAFTPDSTAAEVALFQSDERLGMVFGQAFSMDEAGSVLPGLIKPLGRSAGRLLSSWPAFLWLLKGSHVVCGTVMMSREAVEKAGPFQPQSVPGEDWDIFLKIAAFHSIAYVARPLSYYRIHGGSLTAGFNVEKLRRSHDYTLQRLYERPDLPYFGTKDLAYAYNDRTLALNAAHCRDPKSYILYLSRAVRRRPTIAFEFETLVVLFAGARALVPLRINRLVKGTLRRGAGRGRGGRSGTTNAAKGLENT